MTSVLLDILILSVLAGVSAFRITRLIVSDEILRPWRERHGIAVEGYRGADGTWYDAYSDEQACRPEFKTQRGYDDALARLKGRPAPLVWLRLLVAPAFWLRAFSCEMCASVWISGFIAGIFVIIISLYTANSLMLLAWPVVALVAAGLAAWLLKG